MHWCCDICDKDMYEEFRNNHLQFEFHKRLANSIIKKYKITKSKPNKIDDTIKKYLRSHYKKHKKHQDILPVKILMPWKQINKLKLLQDNIHAIVINSVKKPIFLL